MAAKKLYAVPSNDLESLKIQAEVTNTPEMKFVYGLNQEMKEVLNNSSLS